MAEKGKRLNHDRKSLLSSFEGESGEAWEQIKAFSKSPVCWLLTAVAILVLVGGFAALRFLSTVRAPELAPAQTVSAETPERSAESEAPEAFDESVLDQPLLSGERKENFYTFLLFGTDKEGTNTDTIMVVSYDVKNQKLSLMSIPRDTMVNVGWDIKKVNSVYGMRGLSGFQKQIAKLIGFAPDYYVKIDLQAFVDVVDLIGGVEFEVPIPMHYHDPYQDLSIDLEPGLQTLNGEQAMGLVRFRKSDRGSSGRITGYDDTGRVQTQQAFLREMFKKCVKLTNWTKISSYVEIFERNVESDLSLGNMLWFARQAMGLGEDGFFTVTAPGNYYASAYSRSTGSMQSYVTLYGREMVKLVNEHFNPYLTQVSLSNLDIMGINSDGSVYSSTGSVADSRAALPVAQTRPQKAKPEEPEQTEEPEQSGETGEMPEGAEAPIDPTAEPTEQPTEQPNGEAAGGGTEAEGEASAEGGTPPESGTGAEAEPPTEQEPEQSEQPAAPQEQEPPAETAAETAATDETPTESGAQ